ncbi:MAG: bacillithiol biosynthesis deacetylase BshB1, partial [Planctomycetota bacterium]|nr:bacillithiol biosynthesis deacetylase BshB1 [Planctomycetota bacterium]
MQCDLLVLAPHPDDAELHCGACIAHHVAAGAAVVVVDATAGELGSRGTPEERAREAQAAAEVLGLQARDNLGLPDGHLKADDDAMRAAVVSAIRRYRPGLILAMHPHARHPDHVALGHLARAAHKLAALHNYPAAGETFRGARLLEYEAELPITQPQVLVPCSQTDWDRKRAALACHASQFGLDSAAGPDTAIAQPAFLSWIDHRGASWGYHAGSPFAEALIA